PLGPTGFGNSPYQSHSSYAGNPVLISPEWLFEDGLVSSAELDSYPALGDDQVDFDAVIVAKDVLLREAFANWKGEDAEYSEFAQRSAGWLDDYALYMAIKAAHGGLAWNDWEHDIAVRRPDALDLWRTKVADEARYLRFQQFLFDKQWRRL